MPYYYEVIPLSQINEGLTYQSNEQISLGSIVQIPLRKKTATGVILSQAGEFGFVILALGQKNAIIKCWK